MSGNQKSTEWND